MNTASLKPKTDQADEGPGPQPVAPSLLKVGLLAAASALAGGLAAAWYCRKTLARLRQAEAALELDENPTSANGVVEEL